MDKLAEGAKGRRRTDDDSRLWRLAKSKKIATCFKPFQAIRTQCLIRIWFHSDRNVFVLQYATTRCLTNSLIQSHRKFKTLGDDLK